MDKDIDRHIGELLREYYDGIASREDIARLRELFASAASLPPDLEAERGIFLAIEGMKPLPEAEIAVPEGLEARLAEAIDSAVGQEVTPADKRGFRKSLLFRFAMSVSAAAAVILIATFGWRAINYATDGAEFRTSPADSEILADGNRSNAAGEDSAATVEMSVPADAGAKSLQTTVGNAVPRSAKRINITGQKRHIATASMPQKTRKRANIKVVTDPEEAALLMDQVMTLLQKNVYDARIAHDKAEIILESMDTGIGGIE